jgi:hypothetical protein
VFDNAQYASILFLPSGRPCPAVMTAAELAEFLRLDGKAERTLKFWRDTGLLRGTRLGRRVRYRLCDVLVFLDNKTQAENSSIGLHSKHS